MRALFFAGFAMHTIATRRLSLITLAGSLCLVAACGMDPPPAPGQQPAAAEVSKPAGLALVERTDLTLPAANGTGVRCNIETLGGQGLEAVHPRVAADRAVPVVGWYALPPAPAATAAAVAAQTPPVTADAVSDTAATGDTAAVAPTAAGARKPMLVVSSENGAKHWVVALTDLRERRDVAKALNDPALAKSGFDVELDLSALPAGFYGMHLSDDAHSAESVCGLGRGFVIK